MDKTRGFYPFDLGSTPSGDTSTKMTHVSVPFLFVSPRKQRFRLGVEKSESIARTAGRTLRAAGSRSTIGWRPPVEQTIAAQVTDS